MLPLRRSSDLNNVKQTEASHMYISLCLEAIVNPAEVAQGGTIYNKMSQVLTESDKLGLMNKHCDNPASIGTYVPHTIMSFYPPTITTI